MDKYNPIAYLIDIFNYAMGQPTMFSEHVLLIDFGVLLLSIVIFMLISFKLHKKTIYKRFA